MAKLSVSEIIPGMILLDDVFDESGILLIGNGTDLTQNTLTF